jgi:hypothetical protein
MLFRLSEPFASGTTPTKRAYVGRAAPKRIARDLRESRRGLVMARILSRPLGPAARNRTSIVRLYHAPHRDRMLKQSLEASGSPVLTRSRPPRPRVCNGAVFFAGGRLPSRIEVAATSLRSVAPASVLSSEQLGALPQPKRANWPRYSWAILSASRASPAPMKTASWRGSERSAA